MYYGFSCWGTTAWCKQKSSMFDGSNFFLRSDEPFLQSCLMFFAILFMTLITLSLPGRCQESSSSKRRCLMFNATTQQCPAPSLVAGGSKTPKSTMSFLSSGSSAQAAKKSDQVPIIKGPLPDRQVQNDETSLLAIKSS